VAWKVERVSRPVWHCPGLTRNGPDEERAWRPVLHGEKNARRSLYAVGGRDP